MKIYHTVLFLFFSTTLFAQTQVGQDIDGEAVNDYSGYSVATSGDGKTVAIGAHSNDNAGGTDAGHVRVYELDTSNNWIQKGQDIDGIFSNNWAGTSVAISDDGLVVAVGEQYNSNAGMGASGLTRIFNFIAGNWVQMGQNIYGETAFEYSGYAISLSSDGLTIGIGALYNDGAIVDAGNVRVFDFDGTVWNQKGADIDGLAMDDRFGCSLDLSADGNTIVVGAYLSDAAATDAGQVQVLEFGGGGWTSKGAPINGPISGTYFGYSTSISNNGNTIIIGGSYYNPTGAFQDTEKGIAQIYEFGGGGWNQKGQDIIGLAGYDWLGHDVSISGDASLIAISSPRNDGMSNNNPSGGKIESYIFNGTNWTTLGLPIYGEAPNDWFGYSISLSDNGKTIVAGGINNNMFSGHVRVYKYDSCATDFAGTNQLIGTDSNTSDYETDGKIESIQMIDTNATVDYDSKSCIDLLPGFDAELGCNFHVFIDGCGGI